MKIEAEVFCTNSYDSCGYEWIDEFTFTGRTRLLDRSDLEVEIQMPIESFFGLFKSSWTGWINAERLRCYT